MNIKNGRLIFGILAPVAIIIFLLSFNTGMITLSKSTNEQPEITIEEMQVFNDRVIETESCIMSTTFTFEPEKVLYTITYNVDSTCNLKDVDYYNLVLESVAILSKITDPSEDLEESYFGRVFDIYNFSFIFVKDGKVQYQTKINKGEQYIVY